MKSGGSRRGTTSSNNNEPPNALKVCLGYLIVFALLVVLVVSFMFG